MAEPKARALDVPIEDQASGVRSVGKALEQESPLKLVTRIFTRFEGHDSAWILV